MSCLFFFETIFFLIFCFWVDEIMKRFFFPGCCITERGCASEDGRFAVQKGEGEEGRVWEGA